jgi:phage FluMu protein Com
MKSREEIEQLAFKSYGDTLLKGSFIHGYTQCQKDMAKQEEVDVVCPKCKGVNEYIIIKKGNYECAYTDCQHKFKQTRLI